MSKKGIIFTMIIEKLTNFEDFNNNEALINDLKNLINNVDYGVKIGFSEDNVLICEGKIISFSKKECEAQYTIFKERYSRILKKYYSKFKIIDKMKLYFSKI